MDVSGLNWAFQPDYYLIEQLDIVHCTMCRSDQVQIQLLQIAMNLQSPSIKRQLDQKSGVESYDETDNKPI